MKRSLSIASLSVAALITLSACGSSSGGSMEGMSGMGDESSSAAEPSATAESSTGAMSGGSDDATAEYNDADVMFAQMMLPHHEQAVEMSDMMLAKEDIGPEITDLATRIKAAQEPEIQTMTGWLEAWGEPMEPEGGMENHSMESMGTDTDSDMETDMGSDMGSGSMEGMMSEDQMSELDSAEGTEASRIFLESMTAHHEGAVSMAQDEIDNGQNPEALELAEMIVETQNAEIAEMEELLAGL